MVLIDDSNRNLHKCNTALAGYINITYIKRQYVLTDKKRFCSIGSNDKRQEIATSLEVHQRMISQKKIVMYKYPDNPITYKTSI